MRPDVPARLPTAQVIAAIGGICMAQSLVSGIAFQARVAARQRRAAGPDRPGQSGVPALGAQVPWASWIERYRAAGGQAERRTRRIVLPGQWLLAAQATLLAGLGQPAMPVLLAILGLISLTAATVDIAGDAFAVEQLAENRRGCRRNATQVGSSYLGMFLGAGLFVVLAGSHGWRVRRRPPWADWSCWADAAIRPGARTTGARGPPVRAPPQPGACAGPSRRAPGPGHHDRVLASAPGWPMA